MIQESPQLELKQKSYDYLLKCCNEEKDIHHRITNVAIKIQKPNRETLNTPSDLTNELVPNPKISKIKSHALIQIEQILWRELVLKTPN